MPLTLTPRPLPQPQTPKYWLLADTLRQKIASGALRPGDKMPSFVDLRAEYGVSQSTIERVYRLLEQEGLVAREPSRGTFVAEPVRRTRTGLVGYIGAHAEGPQQFGMHLYGLHLLEGVRSVTQQEKQHLVLLDPDAGELSDEMWERLDAVLTTVPFPAFVKDVREHIQAGTPWVSLLSPLEGVPFVVADEARGIKEAVHYLVGLGHRRIACLTEATHPFTKGRSEAYRQALREADITPELPWVRHLRHYPEQSVFAGAGRERMEEWLADDWHALGCTAILAHNDQVAIGVIEALNAAGLRVPEDVSVVGFDGTEAAAYSRPSLTTIEVPLYEIGRRGMELVAAQLRGEPVASCEVSVPTRLQVGESCTSPQR